MDLDSGRIRIELHAQIHTAAEEPGMNIVVEVDIGEGIEAETAVDIVKGIAMGNFEYLVASPLGYAPG